MFKYLTTAHNGLQESFSSINKLKSSSETSETPVQNFVSTDKERLTGEEDEDRGFCCPSSTNSTILWIVLASLAVVILVGIIIGIVYGVTSTGKSTLIKLSLCCYTLVIS